MTTTFLDEYDRILMVEKEIAKNYRNKFEPEELLNEAWIRIKDDSSKPISLLLKSIKCDTLDYIRKQIGRIHNGSKKNPHSVKPHPQYITNMDSKYSNIFFDIPKEDTNLNHLENKEYVQYILSHLKNKKQIKMIKKYYLEEKKLKEIGALFHMGDANVCSIIKNGINQCRAHVIRDIEEN
jgi:RNA polymerase sigma factor (sigma-70 family)